jgi:hypothetical protein
MTFIIKAKYSNYECYISHASPLSSGERSMKLVCLDLPWVVRKINSVIFIRNINWVNNDKTATHRLTIKLSDVMQLVVGVSIETKLTVLPMANENGSFGNSDLPFRNIECEYFASTTIQDQCISSGMSYCISVSKICFALYWVNCICNVLCLPVPRSVKRTNKSVYGPKMLIIGICRKFLCRTQNNMKATARCLQLLVGNKCLLVPLNWMDVHTTYE